MSMLPTYGEKATSPRGVPEIDRERSRKFEINSTHNHWRGGGGKEIDSEKKETEPLRRTGRGDLSKRRTEKNAQKRKKRGVCPKGKNSQKKRNCAGTTMTAGETPVRISVEKGKTSEQNVYRAWIREGRQRGEDLILVDAQKKKRGRKNRGDPGRGQSRGGKKKTSSTDPENEFLHQKSLAESPGKPF